MLLPQTKEREYRFKLALRMGLPLFALVISFVSYSLIENYSNIKTSFLIETFGLLIFSIYFIFYLIYSGFDVKITDDVSKTFSREYLYNYLQKELQTKKVYTLILISIENLDDINTQYGIKNGDKVLKHVAEWIGKYLQNQNIINFPLGHIKGGDFIIGLQGLQGEYRTILDMMCLKASEFQFENIEIKISGAISDSSYSQELDYIIENLFELQELNRDFKQKTQEESINPDELESLVINAIKNRALVIMSQNIYENGKVVFKECYIKLKASNSKMLYPKTYLKSINRLGLNIEYDLMVLEEIILHTREDKDMIYGINISPTSLRNDNFLEAIQKLIETADIKIMFILNEQEYFSHVSKYNKILNSLKKMGVLICISRLGSIHSSFLYLRELNIDIVRLDTFYSNLTKLQKNRSIIDGFNTMAHEKGIKTWLKNIEENETLALTNELKIDYKQGKYLSTLEKVYEN